MDMMKTLKKLQKHYGDDQPLTIEKPKPAGPVTAEQLRDLAKAASKK
jgi:hypothetical protein